MTRDIEDQYNQQKENDDLQDEVYDSIDRSGSRHLSRVTLQSKIQSSPNPQKKIKMGGMAGIAGIPMPGKEGSPSKIVSLKTVKGNLGLAREQNKPNAQRLQFGSDNDDEDLLFE